MAKLNIQPLFDNVHRSKKLKMLFVKRDQARFFGHLELINIFLRAIRRAGIEVAYSEGFHPMPKISFEDTLPIGMESLYFNVLASLYIRPRLYLLCGVQVKRSIVVRILVILYNFLYTI